MQEHQTIFSIKEVRNKVKNAFINGIPNFEQKIEIIENWQKNINNGKYIKAKEEEICPLFLTQFFGDILGYNYNNSTDWNLRLENKTETDSTKSDAALGYFKFRDNEELPKDVRAVIEIKNAQTPLDKPQNRKDFKGSPVEQAFMYSAKIGSTCNWVIVSNFLEIRLYLANDMTKYESFDILSLTDNYEFSRFYYILANGQLFLENIPSVIEILLSNRIEKEKTITKEFYGYYHFLRELFFYHLKTHNPTIQPFQLLENAQTIIDRIVFISVVKDYDLLPYNVLKEIEYISLKSWAKDKFELWRQLKNFFLAIDEGLPPRIHKFNGGLFRQNHEIEDLNITNIFLNRLLSINNYDFESDLNVNVLGHIFEQSITDIELLKKNISENKHIEYFETDDEIDLKIPKTETNKRKKDGIFYTPEIITQYIVKSTVGAWLENKKNQIGLNDLTDFPKNDQEKEFHIKLWEQYKTVLKEIKILDPACGSGAFLTKTFDYLLKEWQMVFDVIEKLKEKKIELRTNGLFSSAPTKLQQSISQIKKDIVNNNLFGVDLNSESVEITKLGLWLKSASKKDPLALLERNIKCGNSLISDKTITEKAFDWTEGFMHLYNPDKYFPLTEQDYKEQIIKAKQDLEELLETRRKPYQYCDINKLDARISGQKTHIHDLEYELKMLYVWKKTNPQPFNGFDVIIGNPPYVDIKQLPNKQVDYFFKTYSTTENRINLYSIFIEKSIELLSENGYLAFINPNSLLVNSSYLKLRQLIIDGVFLIIKLPDGVFEDASVETIIFGYQKSAIITHANIYTFSHKAQIKNLNDIKLHSIDKKNWNSETLTFNIYTSTEIQVIINKCYVNSDLLGNIADFSLGITPYDKYKGHIEDIIKERKFHSDTAIDNTYKPIISGENIQRYYLSENVKEYIKYGNWLGASRQERFFTEPRIIVRQIISGNPPQIFACFTDKSFYFTQIGFSIISNKNEYDNKYLLSIINSKLINFIHAFRFIDKEKEVFQKLLIENCKQFPIPKISIENQIFFRELVNQLIEINKTINDKVYKFKSNLITNFEKLKITQNLIEFYKLDFKEFIEELSKQKVKINLKKQDEWSDYFKEHKHSINELIINFNDINKKIDLAVYKLYDLTPDEIQLIEKQ
jgi:hypothetical protein